MDRVLTPYETDVALQRLLPQVVVAAERSTGCQLRAFAEITERVRAYPGRPTATTHAVRQDAGGVDGQTGCRVEPPSPERKRQP